MADSNGHFRLEFNLTPGSINQGPEQGLDLKDLFTTRSPFNEATLSQTNTQGSVQSNLDVINNDLRNIEKYLPALELIVDGMGLQAKLSIQLNGVPTDSNTNLNSNTNIKPDAGTLYPSAMSAPARASYQNAGYNPASAANTTGSGYDSYGAPNTNLGSDTGYDTGSNSGSDTAYDAGYTLTSKTGQTLDSGQQVQAKQLFDYFRQQGFSAAQAAGIVGNMQTESTFNTAAFNSKEGAIGLCQFEGKRRTDLEAFAKAQNKPVTDWHVQADFIMSELTGSEGAAMTALKAATTPEQAAQAFQSKYERSASLGDRATNANNIYQQFANTTMV